MIQLMLRVEEANPVESATFWALVFKSDGEFIHECKKGYGNAESAVTAAREYATQEGWANADQLAATR